MTVSATTLNKQTERQHYFVQFYYLYSDNRRKTMGHKWLADTIMCSLAMFSFISQHSLTKCIFVISCQIRYAKSNINAGFWLYHWGKLDHEAGQTTNTWPNIFHSPEILPVSLSWPSQAATSLPGIGPDSKIICGWQIQGTTQWNCVGQICLNL